MGFVQSHQGADLCDYLLGLIMVARYFSNNPQF